MIYVSIDLETTGLNPETCDTIEFGAVIEDTINLVPLESCPVFHTYLLPSLATGTYRGEPYALSMHSEIFKKISEENYGEHEFMSPACLGINFHNWLLEHNVVKSSNDPITVAGKNFSSFDLQFLKQIVDFFYHIRFNHRYIDPAMLYWNPIEDSRVPNMETCLKRAGIDKPVLHTAVDDAKLVIELVRAKFNKGEEKA